MIQNMAKQKMLAGQPALGLVSVLGSTLATGLMANAGYDFVLVDNQHGDWDDTRSLAAFRTISLGNAVPMTRVRTGDYPSIGRLLDRGSLGIIVPMVNTRADALAAAYATRYPPEGGRSWGAPLATHFDSDYRERANQEIFLAVQIETVQAVDNAEDILSVPGVDGCWIGPSDLAASLGVDLATAEGKQTYDAAILRVLEACRRTGKIPGLYTPNAEHARRWLDRGFLFVTVGGDNDLLINGAAQSLDALGG